MMVPYRAHYLSVVQVFVGFLAASGCGSTRSIDARRGKRFGGTLDTARKWGHAEEAFDVWAAELRDRLDALRGAN